MWSHSWLIRLDCCDFRVQGGAGGREGVDDGVDCSISVRCSR